MKNIVVATRFDPTKTKSSETEKSFQEELEGYARIYWYDNPEEGIRVAKQLFSEGKVEQPRMNNPDPRNHPGPRPRWRDAKTNEPWPPSDDAAVTKPAIGPKPQQP